MPNTRPFASPPPPLHATVSWRWFFYDVSMPFASSPPPLHDPEGLLQRFETVRATSASLACKSEPEVYLWLLGPLFPAPTSMYIFFYVFFNFIFLKPGRGFTVQ